MTSDRALNWLGLIGLATALIWNVQDSVRERKATHAEIERITAANEKAGAEIAQLLAAAREANAEMRAFFRLEEENDDLWKEDEDNRIARLQATLDEHAQTREGRVISLQSDHMRVMAELADLRVELARVARRDCFEETQ